MDGMQAVSNAIKAWASQDWRPRCPDCGEPMEDFTTHTMICDNDGMIDVEEARYEATPWVA